VYFVLTVNEKAVGNASRAPDRLDHGTHSAGHVCVIQCCKITKTAVTPINNNVIFNKLAIIVLWCLYIVPRNVIQLFVTVL